MKNGMPNEIPKNITEDDYVLIQKVAGLPHKILNNYNVDGLSEIILHELGHNNSFGLNRAVYLVDNPDFDHLIGAAGYCPAECHFHHENLWEQPEIFVNQMKKAEFGNNVHDFFRTSLKKNDINLNDSVEVKDLGTTLGMSEPRYFSWSAKYGNYGILLFDKKEDMPYWKYRLLSNVAAVLSLCAI